MKLFFLQLFKVIKLLMAFLQKVSFCTFIRNNPCLLCAHRLKKIVISFVTLFISFFLISGCNNDQSKLSQSKLENDRKILFLLYTFRSTGECLREEKSSGNSIYTCSKLNRGLCNVDQLILTSREKIKTLFDLGDLLKKYPECQESAALSGLFKISETSNSEINSIKSNNSFKAIESCSLYKFSNVDKLISSDEYVFLNSTKGKIGTTAKLSTINNLLSAEVKANAQKCITNLFSEKEQTLLDEIQKSTKFKEVKCSESIGSKACDITL